MAKNKVTQSEIDGVQYRRAKLWQIILFSLNTLTGMGVYMLINMSSYAASVGFGIGTTVIGVILTCTRILDAVTDPLLAFVYDKVNTKFGKLRILIVAGFLLEAFALLCMYDLCGSKGFGTWMFVVLYVLYVLGYTCINMTIQTIPAILSNDPKQRPVIGVWGTAFNYLIPTILSIYLNTVLLSKYGSYNQEFLAAACHLVLILGVIGVVLCCIGISEVDKPESFEGLKKNEPLKLKDMVDVLKNNKPLQCYIASAASDKIAQQTAAQSVITTLLSGIIIGNMGLATIISAVGMLPSIIFAIIGARYAGKHGSRDSIVYWTKLCIIFAAATVIFFCAIDPTNIGVMFSWQMIVYVILTFALNGAKMAVTTSNASYMADTIDYELDRSGKYIPAVVSGTYSLIDKLVSAFSAVIATGAVALVGYTTSLPQPGDPSTPAIFWLTMTIVHGMPIIGWIITLVAMKYCHLSKEEMVRVQKDIAEKKAELEGRNEAAVAEEPAVTEDVLEAAEEQVAEVAEEAVEAKAAAAAEETTEK